MDSEELLEIHEELLGLIAEAGLDWILPEIDQIIAESLDLAIEIERADQHFELGRMTTRVLLMLDAVQRVPRITLACESELRNAEIHHTSGTPWLTGRLGTNEGDSLTDPEASQLLPGRVRAVTNLGEAAAALAREISEATEARVRLTPASDRQTREQLVDPITAGLSEAAWLGLEDLELGSEGEESLGDGA